MCACEVMKKHIIANIFSHASFQTTAYGRCLSVLANVSYLMLILMSVSDPAKGSRSFHILSVSVSFCCSNKQPWNLSGLLLPRCVSYSQDCCGVGVCGLGSARPLGSAGLSSRPWVGWASGQLLPHIPHSGIGAEGAAHLGSVLLTVDIRNMWGLASTYAVLPLPVQDGGSHPPTEQSKSNQQGGEVCSTHRGRVGRVGEQSSYSWN